MSFFEPRFIFAVLGPVFLLLALRDRVAAGQVTPRAKAWSITGIVFCAVAAWLWWGRIGP